MNAPFPLGFPLPTAFYLVLYVVTMCVHVVFMNYVLAGTAYLAVVSVFTGGVLERQRSAMALTLRDWMPFALSAAITAGVAPLLFVQVLYQENFYTANLLLFHRWMAILPVLIVGFYLLYLLKVKRIGPWPLWWRAAVGVLAFLCFAFTAYSWTENHLLSLRGQEYWAAFYEAGGMRYHDAQLLPRLGVWFAGSFPTMTLLVGWQLWNGQRKRTELSPSDPKRIAWLALGGIAAAVASGIWYSRVPGSPAGTLFAPSSGALPAVATMALPYLFVAVTGLVVQIVAWLMLLRSTRFDARWLSLATAGVALTVLGMTVVRETWRIVAVDITRLYEQHARAAAVGGLPVFLLFLAGMVAALVWTFRTVRRGQVVESGPRVVA